jgi:SAM-dependent methyltransferase
MLRAVEDSFYQDITLPRPILDLGCGDGHFASVAFPQPLEVGLDPWWEAIKEARSRATYQMIVQSDGARSPFPDGCFGSVVSTSVLEHIPHIQDVIHEVSRVIRPDGMFVFCVPNDRFPKSLFGRLALRKLGFKSAAEAYARFFNRIARHAHCDGVEVWSDRLARAGFCLEQSWDYFPPKALHTLEFGHFLGLPSLVSRKITGRWILAKHKANLWLPYMATRRFMDQRLSQEGVCTFYIARKRLNPQPA